MRNIFGTDGMRGIVEEELNEEVAFQLGRSIISFLRMGKKKDRLKIVIGRDTRITGNMLEESLVSGICSMGADTVILGIVPTPVVALITRTCEMDAGIMITASHNTYQYNGFKIFDALGRKLTDNEEKVIQELMTVPEFNDTEAKTAMLGEKIIWTEGASYYMNYLKDVFCLDLTGLKIAMDCGNGASSFIIPNFFRDLGADVIESNNQPNGKNINFNCGSLYPTTVQQIVIREKTDLGIAFDGDADRLIAVDENGDILNGDAIIGIFAKYLKRNKHLNKNTVVLTSMNNMGLIQTIEKDDCKVVSVEVGDRYIIHEMMNRNLNLGGERSGHIILMDYNTTSDGPLTALMLLKVLKESNRKLSSLAAEIIEFPQIILNASVKNENKHSFERDDEINGRIIRIKRMLEGRGRFLVRISGTEPVIRLLLEGEDTADAVKEVEDLRALLQDKLG